MQEESTAPASSPLDDDRIQFYLRHRDAIKEWAAIESDLHAATHQIMLSLISPAEVRIRELDPSVSVLGKGLDGNWPRIAAYRESWARLPATEPLAAVTLEWTLKVDPTGGALPTYGIRIQADEPNAKPMADVFRTLAKDNTAAAQDGFKPMPYAWWPVYKRTPPIPEWWQNVEAFSEEYLSRFATAWRVLAPIVDQAIAESEN